MNIREPSAEDLAGIRTLVISLSGFYLADVQPDLPNWLAETLTEEQFVSRLNSKEYVHRVALLAEEVVGYLCIKGNNHLYHLFVSEQHQGRGIARALWENIVECCKFSTCTVRSSLYAIPIYKRFGFVTSGPAAEKDGVQYQTMELNYASR